MEIDQFRYKQSKIYNEIRMGSLDLDKLKKATFLNSGGYIVALRHSEDIVEIIKEFNKKISKAITIMQYDECNIHTTMATYLEKPKFEPDESILRNMSETIFSEKYTYQKIKMSYNEFLLDYSAIILSGEFNEVFYKNCDKIISALNANKMKFKYPWGTHITVCRFLEEGDFEQVQEIKGIIAEYKKELFSVPASIDIGYYLNDGKKFELNIYETIDL